jgi:hypothetical protein
MHSIGVRDLSAGLQEHIRNAIPCKLVAVRLARSATNYQEPQYASVVRLPALDLREQCSARTTIGVDEDEQEGFGRAEEIF